MSELYCSFCKSGLTGYADISLPFLYSVLSKHKGDYLICPNCLAIYHNNGDHMYKYMYMFDHAVRKNLGFLVSDDLSINSYDLDLGILTVSSKILRRKLVQENLIPPYHMYINIVGLDSAGLYMANIISESFVGPSISFYNTINSRFLSSTVVYKNSPLLITALKIESLDHIKNIISEYKSSVSYIVIVGLYLYRPIKVPWSSYFLYEETNALYNHSYYINYFD